MAHGPLVLILVTSLKIMNISVSLGMKIVVNYVVIDYVGRLLAGFQQVLPIQNFCQFSQSC